MLKSERPKVVEAPEWTRPFRAHWFEDQWIVPFTDQAHAERGLQEMRERSPSVRLEAAMIPWRAPSAPGWYVGVAD